MTQSRFILVLGKFRVVEIEEALGKRTARVQLGGTTQMWIGLPDIADVREGDLLTYYTEVLTKDAKSSKAPQQ